MQKIIFLLSVGILSTTEVFAGKNLFDILIHELVENISDQYRLQSIIDSKTDK